MTYQVEWSVTEDPEYQKVVAELATAEKTIAAVKALAQPGIKLTKTGLRMALGPYWP